MERDVLGLVFAETVVFLGSHWTTAGTAEISSVSSSLLKALSLAIVTFSLFCLCYVFNCYFVVSQICIAKMSIICQKSSIICSVGMLKSRKRSFSLISFKITFEISMVSFVSFLSNMSSSIHMSSVPKF